MKGVSDRRRPEKTPFFFFYLKAAKTHEELANPQKHERLDLNPFNHRFEMSDNEIEHPTS